MKSFLWKAPWGNQSTVTKHNSHRISISAFTGDKVWCQITRTDTMTHCLAQITGHLLQKYKSKRNIVFNSCIYMTQCNLEGPWASTLLCVKWGCQCQPLRAQIHSRKLSIKLKLTLLCSMLRTTHLVPLHNGYCIPWLQGLWYTVPPTYPTHLSSSRQTKAQNSSFSWSHITRASRPRTIFLEGQRKQGCQ